ncbi:MAG: YeeE/YedE family protein [Myxococcales bacterium]|nr:YeeE/YedE family protein [Myxococcales bacterium]
MTLPSKVIGFFDFSNGLTSWDPSLAFVMGGGVLVYLPVWRLVKGRARPLFDERFRLPTRKDIDGRLLVGAALFGIGWGLGGYCPGPALTSVGSFSGKALVMVASMLLGMVGFQQVEKLRARSKAAREVPSNGKVAS